MGATILAYFCCGGCCGCCASKRESRRQRQYVEDQEANAVVMERRLANELPVPEPVVLKGERERERGGVGVAEVERVSEMGGSLGGVIKEYEPPPRYTP